MFLSPSLGLYFKSIANTQQLRLPSLGPCTICECIAYCLDIYYTSNVSFVPHSVSGIHFRDSIEQNLNV